MPLLLDLARRTGKPELRMRKLELFERLVKL